jgi:hypothetical protein
MKPTRTVACAEKPCKRVILSRRRGERLLGMTGGQTCGDLRPQAGFAFFSRGADMQLPHDLALSDNTKG